MNNDVTRSILADSIKESFQKYIGDSLPFLTGIPLTYEMALEYPPSPFDFYSERFKNAGKYVVKFEMYEGSKGFKLSPEYTTTFLVFTVMDKEQVATLIDKKQYYVNGNFRDFANCSSKTGFILPSGKCLTSYPSIYESSFGGVTFNLGTLILEDVTFNRCINNSK